MRNFVPKITFAQEVFVYTLLQWVFLYQIIINKWHEKDISIKVQAARLSNARKDDFMGSVVSYGYIRLPEIVTSRTPVFFIGLKYRLAAPRSMVFKGNLFICFFSAGKSEQAVINAGGKTRVMLICKWTWLCPRLGTSLSISIITSIVSCFNILNVGLSMMCYTLKKNCTKAETKSCDKNNGGTKENGGWVKLHL